MDQFERAKEVLQQQAAALLNVMEQLSKDSFEDAVSLLLGCNHTIVTTGVGKSGLAAQRLAATLRAGGQASVYLHPTDAVHGDMGMLKIGDVLVVFSRSGESEELRGLIRYATENTGTVLLPVVAVTEHADSWLTRVAKASIVTGPVQESCMLGLTATTSVTVASVLGDALALVVQQAHDRTPNDFSRIHTGGNLGRRCTLQVREVMIPQAQIGVIHPRRTLERALALFATHRGTLVVGDVLVMQGVVTAGDLSRYLQDRGGDAWERAVVQDVMTTEPLTVVPELLVGEAIKLMQAAGVMAVPVRAYKASQKVIGMLHLHDALRSRVQ